MNDAEARRLSNMAAKTYEQKYPYIKEGATLFTIHGPVRVKSVVADSAAHIVVECADGKKYDGAYFSLYAIRSNAPDAVVSAYDAATRSTWKQPNPQPLLSPDDSSIASYARQSYRQHHDQTEQGTPLNANDPLLKKWNGKTDLYGYEKNKAAPFFGVDILK